MKRSVPLSHLSFQGVHKHLQQYIFMMNIKLVHVLMKINQVLCRMIMIISSKPQKVVSSFMHSRHNIWKTRNTKKSNGANLRAKMASIAFNILDQWSCQLILPSWSHKVNDTVRKSVQLLFTIKS